MGRAAQLAYSATPPYSWRRRVEIKDASGQSLTLSTPHEGVHMDDDCHNHDIRVLLDLGARNEAAPANVQLALLADWYSSRIYLSPSARRYQRAICSAKFYAQDIWSARLRTKKRWRRSRCAFDSPNTAPTTPVSTAAAKQQH